MCSRYFIVFDTGPSNGVFLVMKTVVRILKGTMDAIGRILSQNADFLVILGSKIRTIIVKSMARLLQESTYKGDTVYEQKLTHKKNALQSTERNQKRNAGLVTAFLRHQQAGYDLINPSKKR
jgi:hypothetical protein